MSVTSPRCPSAGENIYSYLHSHLSSLAKTHSAVDLLTSALHVWPDFHGNRSPLADPSLKGMVEPLFCSPNIPCTLMKTSRGLFASCLSAGNRTSSFTNSGRLGAALSGHSASSGCKDLDPICPQLHTIMHFGWIVTSVC